MSDEPPILKDSKYAYEDKPVFATMLSGGIFIALVLYFLLNQFLKQFPSSTILRALPLVIAVLVVISSGIRGRQVDVLIEMNTANGWVKAQNRTHEWEGYFFDAEQMQVLQRESQVGDNIMTEYKLYVKLHDQSEYSVPLRSDQAREALHNLEEMQKHVPKKPSRK